MEFELNFIWIAVGLALLGYFIGNGLKQFSSKNEGNMNHLLVEQSHLHLYFYLSEADMKDLLQKHPHAPKVILNGKHYYHLHKFRKWLESDDLYHS
ncbi:DNA-binding protein [Cytobacillus kochii]|uniref:DNA-binding protein n=1 Tax=Cytobacillus kochii TaxID=859143 RepID=UPI00384B52C0